MIPMTTPQISLLILMETQKKTPNQSIPAWAVVTATNAIASALKLPEAQSQSQQNSTPKLKKKKNNKFQVLQSLHAHVPVYTEPFVKL